MGLLLVVSLCLHLHAWASSKHATGRMSEEASKAEVGSGSCRSAEALGSSWTPGREWPVGLSMDRHHGAGAWWGPHRLQAKEPCLCST